MIFASEDVGNADPRALQVATSADAAFRRMGMPEGIYPVAHACLYLASCPKSAAVKAAIGAARAAIEQHGALPTPKKLRNAVTRLMKDEGYGDGYKYPPALLRTTIATAAARTATWPKAWWLGSAPTKPGPAVARAPCTSQSTDQYR